MSQAISIQPQIGVGSKVKLISKNGPATSGGGTAKLTIGKIYEILKFNPRTDLYMVRDDSGWDWWVNEDDIMIYGAQPIPSIARAVKNFSDALNKRVTGDSGDDVQEGQCKTLDEEVFPTYKPDVW